MRTGLRYTLVTRDYQFAIYAANVEQQLAQFVDSEVLERGKLVDLSDEDFGQELWIALPARTHRRLFAFAAARPASGHNGRRLALAGATWSVHA
jgi:hypothetical protein